MEYRFKEIRENNNLKQHEVASLLGISRGAYANIEAECANIKLRLLLKYCNVFKCTLDYITFLTDKNNTKLLNNISEIDKNIMAKRLGILEVENKKEAKDIAFELGIDKSTYSHYKSIKDNEIMQSLMLKKLCDKYKFSMDYLIGRSDTKKIQG